MHRLLKLTIGGALAAGTAATVVLTGGTSGADGRVTPARLTGAEAADRSDEAARRAGPDQRPAFADGIVTAEEYAAAADRTLGCVVAALRSQAPAGATIESTGPTWSADGFQLTYTYGVRRPAGGPSAPGDPTTLERRCQDRHLVQVERAYAAQFQGSARLDRVAAGYRTCATEAGIDLPEGDARQATADYLESRGRRQLPDALARCLSERPALLEDGRTG